MRLRPQAALVAQVAWNQQRLQDQGQAPMEVLAVATQRHRPVVVPELCRPQPREVPPMVVRVALATVQQQHRVQDPEVAT